MLLLGGGSPPQLAALDVHCTTVIVVRTEASIFFAVATIYYNITQKDTQLYFVGGNIDTPVSLSNKKSFTKI